jgi:hypothetical protein
VPFAGPNQSTDILIVAPRAAENRGGNILPLLLPAIDVIDAEAEQRRSTHVKAVRDQDHAIDRVEGEKDVCRQALDSLPLRRALPYITMLPTN